MKISSRLISVLKRNKSIEALYLFGSQARGDAGPLSDIDLCIVGKNCSKEDKFDLLGYGSEKVDIVFFDDLPLSIKVRILREGRLLFKKKSRYFDDLSWRTLKEYFDFTPHRIKFLEMYLPEVSHV